MSTDATSAPAGGFDLTRRVVPGALFAGYAAFALDAAAAPITTDSVGILAGPTQIAAADRPIPAYGARPSAPGRHPVVIVVSEVFGVHAYIQDVCRRLAKLGYVAIAPDFFARYGDPAPLSDFAAIRKIVSQVSYDQAMADVWATVGQIRNMPFADARRLAITGFCWGGAVVWQALERYRDFRCGVAWYGRLSRPKPGEFLGEPERSWPLEHVDALKAPVLGLYAGKDSGIPLGDVEAMRAALRQYRKRGSEIIVYPEAQHGFHADYRSSYDPQAATDGWARMLAFFDENGARVNREFRRADAGLSVAA